MKKILTLFIVALIVLGGFNKLHNSNARTITPVEEKQLQEVNENQKRLEKLKQLQNPEIIEGKLRNIGKLTVLESEMKFSSKITDTFIKIPIRGMTLDLSFSWGIGINLEYIKAVSIVDRIIILEIPKNQVQLMYIQFNAERSQVIDGKKMFMVSQFKPSEVEELIEDSQRKVVNAIGKDQKYWNMAMDNLKGELEKMLKSYGYTKVMFREV